LAIVITIRTSAVLSRNITRRAGDKNVDDRLIVNNRYRKRCVIVAHALGGRLRSFNRPTIGTWDFSEWTAQAIEERRWLRSLVI
jgi:hypothetical protein